MIMQKITIDPSKAEMSDNGMYIIKIDGVEKETETLDNELELDSRMLDRFEGTKGIVFNKKWIE